MGNFLVIIFLLIIVFVGVNSCGESSDVSYQRGHQDGYAVGYNTACKIRATLIHGDWGNKHYSRGYAAGNTSGMIACQNK